MTKQTAIYARQSVDKKESLSIEGQIEQCENKLSKNDVPLIYKDKGYSGKNTSRPELQRLIEDIQANKIDRVIVYKLDRISRSITDFYKLFEIMQDHNCDFVSATEPFDTTGMGVFLMGVLALFAQLERENIQKRVKDNYYYRTATTGSWAGGPAPYGFKNGRNEENKPTLIPIPEEIEAVELMFALYCGVEHCSLGEVARNLNQRGYKPHKREVFDSVTVSKILQNPIYVKADPLLYSYFKTRKIKFLNKPDEWNGTRSAHVIGKKVGNANIRSYTTMAEQSIYLTNFPGFIQSAHYISVQEQLAENEQFARNNVLGQLEELGGKIKCKKCGYAVKSYSSSTNGRPYIDCYGNRSLKVCDQKIHKVNFYDLQEVVGKEIQKKLDGLDKLWKKKEKESNKFLEKIEQKKKEIDQLVKISMKGEKEERAVERVLSETQTELDNLELEYRRSLSASGIVEVYLSNNLTLEESIKNGVKYEDLNTEQKREVVQILVDRIYLTEDINTFEIGWKI